MYIVLGFVGRMYLYFYKCCDTYFAATHQNILIEKKMHPAQRMYKKTMHLNLPLMQLV